MFTVQIISKTEAKNVEEIIQENVEQGLGVFWFWQGDTYMGKIEPVTKFTFIHADGKVTEIASNYAVKLSDWE